MQQLGIADVPDGLGEQHLGPDWPAQLLPLLLPSASAQELEYAAAMLQPFGAGSGSSMTLDGVAGAAAECAAVERRLREQPAPEALHCLRQLAAVLGSRSLDLTAAFAGAEGGRMPCAQLVRGHGGRMPGWCELVKHSALPFFFAQISLLRLRQTSLHACRRLACCAACTRVPVLRRRAACWRCWHRA